MSGSMRAGSWARLAAVTVAAAVLGACSLPVGAPGDYPPIFPAKSLTRQQIYTPPPVPREKPGRRIGVVAAQSERRVASAPLPAAQPGRDSAPPATAQPAARATLPRPVRRAVLADYHEVAPGETIYSIAKHYGVQTRMLVVANDLPAPYTISIGQRLRLPAGAVVPMAPTLAPVAEPAAMPAESIPPAVVAAAAAGPLPMPRWKPLSAPPPRSQSQFAWPMRGRLLSAFGPKPGGLHNDGINIAAVEGTAVRAAEAGVVVYLGNELRGFGNLLLVRHADGWMSAYGHLGEIAVRRGDMVRRGQVLARVGRSGRIDRPQLHFELRKGRSPVDPMLHLAPLDGAPAQAVSRDVRLAGPPDPG